MTGSYIVTGKRGYGSTRVEWEFSPMGDDMCYMTCRIYGSNYGPALVTRYPVSVDSPASVAAVACINAGRAMDDWRTVKTSEQRWQEQIS
jgi:hypothetical protein